MTPFSWIFVCFVGASTLCELWLLMRQERHVRAHREQVPAAFAERVPLGSHQKAADYSVAKARFGRWVTLYGAGVTLLWTVGGGLALLDQGLAGAGLPPPWAGVAVVLGTALLTSVATLPLAVYRTFGLEQRFGFNKTTVATFIADRLKGLVVSLLLGAPLLAAVLWLMQRAGTGWWVYAWLLWSLFNAVVLVMYPRVIAPWFNRFTPLPEGPLRERVEALLRRIGFASDGVFVMDGSRRSAHGNAYFTGLGRHKRIVIFDTLLRSLSPEELEGVLAHELGHYALHHIRTRLLVSVGLGLGGFALLGFLAGAPWFYAAFSLTPSAHAALLAFMWASQPFAYFFTPLAAAWSRRHEYAADAFARRHSSAAALAQGLVRLYDDNASTLTPDPVRSAFHDSHPPPAERIRLLLAAMPP